MFDIGPAQPHLGHFLPCKGQVSRLIYGGCSNLSCKMDKSVNNPKLMKSKNINREDFLKEEKNMKKKQKDKNKGKVFWISKFDPRIPHPREVLSQNFNILEGDPIAKKSFQ